LIEILGLPLAVREDPAQPHVVKVERELLKEQLDSRSNLNKTQTSEDQVFCGIGSTDDTGTTIKPIGGPVHASPHG
jgi:hypothetical protein